MLLESNKNYVCSNSRKIICYLCQQEHFERCGSIFFISIDEIDNKCCDHKLDYESFCGLCQINLCNECVKEHFHFVEKEKEEKINLTKEDLNRFN